MRWGNIIGVGGGYASTASNLHHFLLKSEDYSCTGTGDIFQDCRTTI